MDAPTDSDLDADEQNQVLKTLSEQETSTPSLVRRVLSQVQAEFTAWNISYCREALTSFTPPSTWPSCSHPDFRSPTLNSIPSPLPHVVLPADSSLPLVSQQVYSPDGAVTEVSSVNLEIIHVSSSMEPHPPYESCSSLFRSIFKGDDSDDMKFIPYADDCSFDQISHTHHYESFSWQDILDPDLEMIVFEAAYRLQTNYAVAYDEIEECNVLPFRLRSRPGVPGLLSTFRRRDRFHWPGNTIPTSYIFPPPTRLKGSDFRNRLQTLNSLFCPNLSCVEPLCSVHVEPNPMPLGSHSLSSHEFGGEASPCRNQCLINNKMKDASPWDDADLDMFSVICEISPNATPCDLAELCLKPCFEVYHYRKLLHPFGSGEVQRGKRGPRHVLRFNDKDPAQFTPNDPCHHAGPCGSSSGCPCFKNQSHCQRNCRCSLECNRRWQGCHCSTTKSGWSCATERCPCVEALRECDPELCVDCRCIGKLTHSGFVSVFFLDLAGDTPCRNSQILRGASKILKVEQSDWGLGAFLTEAAKAEDLITEYVGEVIYELTVESRGDLAAHRKRCYVFGLNNTFSLDATYAGNISRYIDHSDAQQVNSQARVRLVNGDHRIGIFAIRDMEAGSQILMNYGSLFFK